MSSIYLGLFGANFAHSSLIGLSSGDDHTQYAFLLGRAGGQILIGGTASGNNLTLQSTSHVTKGKLLFGTSAYDEVNNRLGINMASPVETLDVTGNAVVSGAIQFGTYGSMLVPGTGVVRVSANLDKDQKALRAAGCFFQTNDNDFAVTMFSGATINQDYSLGTVTTPFHIFGNGVVSLLVSTAYLDLSAISAGNPNLKITATSDTPTVAFTGGGSAPTTAPAGYIEILVGATTRYIPFWV